MSCAACCTAVLEQEEHLRCTLAGCGKLYHLLCTGVKKTSESYSAWVCPECCCTTKRGGDNSLTPVGVSKKTRDPNVTYRKQISSTAIHPNDTDITSEIRCLRQEITLLKDQLSSAVTLISSYESKINGYASLVEELHNKFMTCACVSVPAKAVSPQFQSRVTSPRKNGAKTPDPGSSKSKHKPKKGEKLSTEVPPPPPRRPSQQVVANKPIASSSANTRSDVRPAGPEHKELENQQQWTEVKRSRRPPSLCGTAGPSTTTLKAVEPRLYIHLWNMESSAEEVSDYLRHLCPTGTCTVLELTPKGDYKSYKIGVPVGYRETCMSIDVWPVNARIKAWVNYRAQPFRGRPSHGASTSTPTAKQ